MKREDAIKEMLRLLETDYDRTTKFIESCVTRTSAARGWAITISLALLGAGFDRRLWEISSLAIVVILGFALIDAYQSWLYQLALQHSKAIEAILRNYYARLARGEDDPDTVIEFEVSLEAHDLGLTSNLVRFQLATLRMVRPGFVFVVLYGLLLVAAIAATLLVAFVVPPATSN